MAELVGEVKLCVLGAEIPKSEPKNKEKRELVPKNKEKKEQAPRNEEKKEQAPKQEKKDAEPEKEKTASQPRKEKKELEPKHSKETTVKKIEDTSNKAPVTISTDKVSLAPESKKSGPLDLLPQVTSHTFWVGVHYFPGHI